MSGPCNCVADFNARLEPTNTRVAEALIRIGDRWVMPARNRSPLMIDEARARELALAASHQATDGSAEMLRFTREGPHFPDPFGGAEPIEKFADATKLAIEASMAAGEELHEDQGQLLAALTRYLEGWVG